MMSIMDESSTETYLGLISNSNRSNIQLYYDCLRNYLVNDCLKLTALLCIPVKYYKSLMYSETRPCETTSFRTGNPEQKFHNDYDVIDPYEADRKEAMKQLYPDDIPENSQENSNFIKLPRDGFRAHSAGLNTHLKIRIGKSNGDIFGWVENPDYDWDVLNEMYNGRPSMPIRKLDQGVQPIINKEKIEDLDLLGSNIDEINSFLNFTTTTAVPIT
uniref:INCENP_ARK-bind domain-containing protein n=1 Tax=Heterorhabditis bacteriophora TaxID=37862 RepID=A0A1I7XCK6_HETBA